MAGVVRETLLLRVMRAVWTIRYESGKADQWRCRECNLLHTFRVAAHAILIQPPQAWADRPSDFCYKQMLC